MSAKGLPPAVRLDLLLPLSHPSSHQSPSHHESEGGARSSRPPPSSLSYVVPEAPKSMSKTPPISNNQVVHVKPRGLTPIIITPSSSRAHTPVQLLPLPPALVFPQPDPTMLSKPEVKKLKISPKLEPVNLEPLLPTKKEEPCRAMAVVDDAEAERIEERIHVHRGRNDQSNHQLPTPQTTPLAQALDTVQDNDKRNCDCGSDRGRIGEPSLRYTSTRTGKTVSFAPLLLDNVRPISLDPEAHPPVDSYHPERAPTRERDIVERGRKRERGPSRFRNHDRYRHRPAPYDLKSRPGSSKDSQESSKSSEKCNPRVYTGQLKLGDIAAAAALVMNEADQVNSSSGSTNSSSTGHSVSSDSSPTSSAPAATTTGPTPILASSSSATILALQSGMPTPSATPPHHHNSTQQTVDHQNPIKGDLDPYSRPSRAIHEAADEMMQLFSNEFHSQMARERELMQEHLSRERQQLFADVQREREALERARAELQREREMLRGELVKELYEENEALKARIRQLQAALDVVQGGRS